MFLPQLDLEILQNTKFGAVNKSFISQGWSRTEDRGFYQFPKLRKFRMEYINGKID